MVFIEHSFNRICLLSEMRTDRIVMKMSRSDMCGPVELQGYSIKLDFILDRIRTGNQSAMNDIKNWL